MTGLNDQSGFNTEKSGIQYDLSLLLGSTILIFYAALTLEMGIVFILRGSLSTWWSLLAILAAIAFYFFSGKKSEKISFSRLAAGFALFCLLTGLLLAAAGWVYDITWDGRDYQQRAIERISQGWNPVYQELEPKDVYYNQWLNHYPKAPWIAAASIYQLTGNLEAGKAVNLLLIACLFLISFSLSRFTNLNPWLALGISLLLAFNPVSVCQSFSYYVDGQIGSIIAILFCLLLYSFRKRSGLIYLAISAALIVGLNIKFTATAYIAAFAFGLFIWQIIRERWSGGTRRLFAAGITSLFLGIFVAGFQPYVTNMIGYGNPFYPFFASNEFGQSRITRDQIPTNFEGKNILEKIVLSIFSRSENVYQRPTSPIKFPLSVQGKELLAFLTPDLRVGGFGPWFGAVALITGAAFLLILTDKNSGRVWIFFLAGFVMLTVLINPEGWWARYAPQLWIVPIILLAACMVSRIGYIKVIGLFLLAILTINTLLVTGSYLYQNLQETQKARTVLSTLARQDQEVLIYYQPFGPAHLLFEKWRIHYKSALTMSELPCPHEFMNGLYYSLENCSP